MTRKTDQMDIAAAKPAIRAAFDAVSDLFFRGGQIGWGRSGLLVEKAEFKQRLDEDARAFVEDIAQGRPRKGVETKREAVIAWNDTGSSVAAVLVIGRRHIVRGALDWKNDARDRKKVHAILRQADAVVLDQPDERDLVRFEAILREADVEPEEIVEIPRPAHSDLRDYIAGSWWVHIPHASIKPRALDRALRGALKLRSIRSTALVSRRHGEPRVVTDETPATDAAEGSGDLFAAAGSALRTRQGSAVPAAAEDRNKEEEKDKAARTGVGASDVGRTPPRDPAPVPSSAPTPRQLAFARAIATRLGITLEDDVVRDRRACSAFIEANKDRTAVGVGATTSREPDETSPISKTPDPSEAAPAVSRSARDEDAERLAAIRLEIETVMNRAVFLKRLVGPGWRRDPKLARDLHQRLESLAEALADTEPHPDSDRAAIAQHICKGYVSDEETTSLRAVLER